MTKQSGIYCFYFIVAEKVKAAYIGQSINLPARKKYQLNRLRSKTHNNSYFQRLFNKYGESSLHYKILEYCDGGNLSAREQYWFDEYSKTHKMINQRAFLPGQNNVRPHTEETKLKIGKAHLGKSITDETRKKMSEARKGKPWSEKRRQSQETTKFSPELFELIRQERLQGKTLIELSQKYGPSKTVIKRIILHQPPYNK